jgi:hypothetical protein
MKKLAFLIVSAVVPMLNAAPVLDLSWDIGIPTPNGKNAASGNYTQDYKASDSVLSVGTISLSSALPAANVANSYRGNYNGTFTTAAAALAGGQYLSINVTPTGTVNFEKLVLNLQTATASTFTWNLYSDKTGSALLQSLSNGTTNAIINWQIDLTGFSALQNVSTSTEFRIYGYREATGANKEAGFANAVGSEDIGVYAAAAVPEPAALGLLGFGHISTVVAMRFSARRGNT